MHHELELGPVNPTATKHSYEHQLRPLYTASGQSLARKAEYATAALQAQHPPSLIPKPVLF